MAKKTTARRSNGKTITASVSELRETLTDRIAVVDAQVDVLKAERGQLTAGLGMLKTLDNLDDTPRPAPKPKSEPQLSWTRAAYKILHPRGLMKATEIHAAIVENGLRAKGRGTSALTACLIGSRYFKKDKKGRYSLKTLKPWW